MFNTQTRKTPTEALVADVTAFLQAQTGCYNGKPLDQLTPADVEPNFHKLDSQTGSTAAPATAQ